MTEILESEAFCIGLSVGINLYQSVVVSAHERRESIRIGNTLYYLQDGRERLQEAMIRCADKIHIL